MFIINVLCVLFVTAGNLILCVYSVHVLILSINKENPETATIFQALFGVLYSCAPIIIIPFIINSYLSKTNKSIFMIVLIMTVSFFVGIRWTKKWWIFIASIEKDLENNSTEDNEVYDFPYIQLRSDIFKLCHQAGVTNVELFLTNEKSINGYARANYIKPNSITLTEGCLGLTWPEIAAIVGHEIVHIKYKDNTIMAVIWRIVGGLLLIFLLIVYILLIQVVGDLSPIAGEVLTILTLPIVILYEISMLVFLTIDNRRYWYQIQELRADRLACELHGVKRSAMLDFLEKEVVREESWFKKLYWYKKIYYRYFILLEHPSAKHRLKLINNYRKWSFVDYGIHILQVTKWFFSGKGWNGL